jgi:hypothetical protein
MLFKSAPEGREKKKEEEKLERKWGTENLREEMTKQICDRNSSRVRGGETNEGKPGELFEKSDEEIYHRWEQSDEKSSRVCERASRKPCLKMAVQEYTAGAGDKISAEGLRKTIASYINKIMWKNFNLRFAMGFKSKLFSLLRLENIY